MAVARLMFLELSQIVMPGSLRAALFTNFTLSALLVYGLFVEPLWIQLNVIRLPAPFMLRIVQLSDLHVERVTHRERMVIQKVRELKPDLILLTGDYVNLASLSDGAASFAAKEVLSQLSAPMGVYAIAGNVDHGILDSLQVSAWGRLLSDERAELNVGNGKLQLIAIEEQTENDSESLLVSLTRETRPDDYVILLHHSPDLADAASSLHVNLYLSGHTHGGQLRIPFYGALTTLTRTGKRFEKGLYGLGNTNLYVNAGTGMEGFEWTPRIRFLSRPEIAVFDLSPPL